MHRRVLVPAIALVLAVSAAGVAAPATAKWPPWISIESPVNPFDQSVRGAAFLIHARLREGVPTLANVSATAEGLVDGVRRSVPVRIDSTSQPAVFAVRRQWPSRGAWLVRITLLQTTAIVTLDRDGNVAAANVPTAGGQRLPRAVPAQEIDSILAGEAKR